MTAAASTAAVVATGPSARAPMSLATVSLVIAATLTGLSAGFFYTYEASITIGLAQVDDQTYVSAFQAINATIRNPYFGLIFFGPVVAIALALVANWKQRRARLLIGVALVSYLALVIITFTGNVPLNDELAIVNAGSMAAATAARQDFEAAWNQLNLIRTVPVVGSFLALLVATALSGQRT